MSKIVLLLLLTSCGQFDREWKCGIEGNECEKTDSRSEDGESDSTIQGSQGPRGAKGPKGDTGLPGSTGENGSDGSSCSVEQLANGVRWYCTDGSEGVVYNGEDGQPGEDGEDGEDADSTANTYDPCDDHPGKIDEVLYVMNNGDILRIYNNKYLTILGPGDYTTQDGSKCHFTIDLDNQIVNESY